MVGRSNHFPGESGGIGNPAGHAGPALPLSGSGQKPQHPAG